jgi:hypothetical protein
MGCLQRFSIPFDGRTSPKRFKPSGKSSKTFRLGGDQFIMVCQILSWQSNKLSRSHMCGTRFARNCTHRYLDMLLAELLQNHWTVVTSKPLDCGGAEQTWGAFKHLKKGKWSHMSAEKLQQQTTVYGASSIERSRAMHAMEERQGLVLESHSWSDADIAYHTGILDVWLLPAPVAGVMVAPVVAGVLVPPVVVAPLQVLAPVVVARVVVAPVAVAPVVPPVVSKEFVQSMDQGLGVGMLGEKG